MSGEASSSSSPSSNSRIPRRDKLRLTVRLTERDAIPYDGELFLTPVQAFILTKDSVHARSPNEPYEECLTVYDSFNDSYYMNLTNKPIADSKSNLRIASGWGRFVATHGLKAGDEVMFYEIDEWDVLGRCCFTLRVLLKENLVLTKILTTEDLLWRPQATELKLRLTPSEAYHLTGDSITVEKPRQPVNRRITVYDSADEMHYLFLTRSPAIDFPFNVFRLVGGWTRVVVTHSLGVGDKVMFYKIDERDMNGRNCYALRIIKKDRIPPS
ncbi:hypothetical protein M569_07546 [Genlisea aurea]|uniref:TF-B3 domain-containing protein n=1 Tax=Genlisea aurea TaxID=192259 RepID=S8CJI2_9LAMI|nr:hypothetical protein M569_07546 [Genlisea aurea]